MNKGAWQATALGLAKSQDTTEQLTCTESYRFRNLIYVSMLSENSPFCGLLTLTRS